MIRHSCTPRPDWTNRVEDQGFLYHSLEYPYWDESHYYELSLSEALAIEQASDELHLRCLEGVQYVIERDLFARLGIDSDTKKLVIDSWERQDQGIYGRFDLVWGPDGHLKMLEYNAETPISLLEAARIQRYWKQDVFPTAQQFNAIPELLRRAWQLLALNKTRVHFSCDRYSAEDIGNLEYMRGEAAAAGIATEITPLQDIRYDSTRSVFLDQHGELISTWFKLYPWTWLLAEPYGAYLTRSSMQVVEPAWKLLLANKGLLVVLWELFEGHPNLLRASFSRESLEMPYVRKPFGGIQGSNVSIHFPEITYHVPGDFADQPVMYQEFVPTIPQGGMHAVLGSWIIGGKAAGIGIRDNPELISDDQSLFVPHIVV